MPKQLIRKLDKLTLENPKGQAGQYHRLPQGKAGSMPETTARQITETPLAIAERWQDYFAGRSFSDSTEMIRKHRQG